MAGCFVGIVVCIILILRKRRIADGIFNGTTKVYKVMAKIKIQKFVKTAHDVSYANFIDSIYLNPPKSRDVIFADTHDAEKFYEKTTGESLTVGTYELENAEAIIVKKGGFERAFPLSEIE